jgi:hypothetical protein
VDPDSVNPHPAFSVNPDPDPAFQVNQETDPFPNLVPGFWLARFDEKKYS